MFYTRPHKHLCFKYVSSLKFELLLLSPGQVLKCSSFFLVDFQSYADWQVPTHVQYTLSESDGDFGSQVVSDGPMEKT